MKYIVCPRCGAHLDHGEKCECEEDDDEATGHERRE